VHLEMVVNEDNSDVVFVSHWLLEKRMFGFAERVLRKKYFFPIMITLKNISGCCGLVEGFNDSFEVAFKNVQNSQGFQAIYSKTAARDQTWKGDSVMFYVQVSSGVHETPWVDPERFCQCSGLIPGKIG